MDDLSTRLRACTGEDQSALESLTTSSMDELRRMARHNMKRERHSPQTTALVNDVYMRLLDYNRMQWQNRAHFLAVSAWLYRELTAGKGDGFRAVETSR